jgi:biotin-(acetyl-CoA carboxylase) ligase
MIQPLNKKLAREKLYSKASEAELSVAQSGLVKANEAVEHALSTLKDAEQASLEAFENAAEYLSLNNLCPIRVTNLHREIENKHAIVEKLRRDYDLCVDTAKRATEEFIKKNGQSETFQKRAKSAIRGKAFLVHKIEDSRATELYMLRTGSEK